MLGALLAYGLAPFGRDFLSALQVFWVHLLGHSLPSSAGFSQMFALSGAILLGVHLLFNLITTLVRAERLRRRHAQLVNLLSSPMPEQPATLLIDHAAPVAYCLPGPTRSVTVLSAGLLLLLDEEQLHAVTAHEQAHASQRHHLVLLAFRAWRSALPWFPIATRAHEAVSMLVEMLADDNARKVVSDDVLIRSILIVAAESSGWTGPDLESVHIGATPWRTAAHGDLMASKRIARLVDQGAPLSLPARVVAALAAVMLTALPTVLVFAAVLP
jgi:Zn-dependent protease with chaperone function